MTSLPVPVSFRVGSTMSAASSVRDVIASYRRAQYIAADAGRVSTQAEDEALLSDEEQDFGEARLGRFDEHDEDDYYDHARPTDEARSPRPDDFVNQLEWDEDLLTSGSMGLPATSSDHHHNPPTTAANLPPMRRGASSSQAKSPRRTTIKQLPGTPASLHYGLRLGSPIGGSETPRAGATELPASFGVRWDDRPSTSKSPVLKETTPLLSKKTSVSFDVSSKDPSATTTKPRHTDYEHLDVPSSTAQRRPSNASLARSARSVKDVSHTGRSTFGQTLFNSIAILVGIGMLSEPLAFAYSGWVMGTVLISLYGALACHTRFGPRATVFVSFMFCLEVFAVSVVLVTLYADSLHTLIPEYSANTYKVWGLLVLIPTVFLPLSLLSYTSILGIISTVLLIVVVLIDGAFKKQAPGSFWDPAETSIGIASMSKLGMAFGLFMAGFAGHAVIPSLAKDMVDPSQFDRMINWAFVAATAIYAMIGYAGYLMYGNGVSDEISRDMLNTPGFNPLLNQAALWMLVLNPLSKFALGSRPLMSILENLLGLDPPDHAAKKETESSTETRNHRATLRSVLSKALRVVVTCAAVGVSIFIPEFSVMMAFLGSFSAFCISVVGPIAAKVKIEGKCGLLDATIMIMGTVMAIWGTLAAFMN
ncbi:hypothetical protein NP233_g9874 [Leucocoprinus birnbaumii]|uniref:Amino acid transporter transmembrane domain-containing protein n=1 Tax=Leucocoprinus birnbaumii TaxID=56174 RepID=A0AAD5VJM2_9AGAR|nr:hypothetical protein NP233_g9874 [Leucocoprinus birnbaumii]